MTKIQITDSNDEKKAAQKSAATATGATKTNTAKSDAVKATITDTSSIPAADAISSAPKRIKKIAVEKADEPVAKTRKSAKTTKSTKPSAHISKAATRPTSAKSTASAKRIAVKSATKSSKKSTKKSLGKIAVKATSEKSTKSTKSTNPTKATSPAAAAQSTASSASKRTSSKGATSSTATHSFLQKSTTLSRRYVKRPDTEIETKAEVTPTPVSETSAETVVTEKNTEIVTAAETETETVPTPPDTRVREIDNAKETKTAETAPIEPKEVKAAEPVPIATKLKPIEKIDTTKVESPEAAVAPAKPAVVKTAPAAKPEITPAAKSETASASIAKTATKPVAKPATKPAGIVTPKPAPKVSTKADDRALKSAMRNVATMGEPDEMSGKFRKQKKGGRIALALACSAITVGALFAFVQFNMPDISVKVAAIQTGIEASYPDIIPRGYSLTNVSSDKDGEIVMSFQNSEGYSFTLSEENSTWDSTALLNNYVKKNFSADYVTMREQGITIYVDGDSATWVNGGILYKTTSRGKMLTKEQIRNLATS